MQTETQKTDWKALVRAGLPYSAPPVEPEPETKEKISYSFRDMIDAAEKLNPRIKHKESKHDKLTDEDKKRLCTRNSGIFGIAKQVSGHVKVHPVNCNLCAKCYEANTLKLKVRVESIKNMAEESEKPGQWRRKIVDEGTEAQSLKKRIKRNQGDTRFEITSGEPGKSEVWSYIEDEPGKDMDEIYGEVADPNDIDFDDLYRRNRETGKSFSVGSAYKKKGAKPKKEDTERLPIPEIIVKDVTRQDEAANIIEKTNYIELANTPEEAKRLFIYQFRFILKELERVNIEIAAIKMNYYNMAKETLLDEWNSNVNYWMSINASKSKNREGDMDITSHLIFPKSKKADIAIQ
jgi:hypothetical protein